MKAVVLLSIPGTGTNFVKGLIQAHPEIAHSVGWSALRKSETFIREEISPGAWSAGLDRNGTTLVSGHFDENHLPFLMSLMAFCPTVVPLRDPLLSLITRHQHGDSTETLNGMVRMWEWLARCKLNPLFFPVDLLEDIEGDKRFVRGEILYAHLQLEGYQMFIRGENPEGLLIADKWTPVNTQGDYQLKDMYLYQEFADIKAEIGQPVQRLQDIEPALRPLLEREGYEDLIWWT